MSNLFVHYCNISLPRWSLTRRSEPAHSGSLQTEILMNHLIHGESTTMWKPSLFSMFHHGCISTVCMCLPAMYTYRDVIILLVFPHQSNHIQYGVEWWRDIVIWPVQIMELCEPPSFLQGEAQWNIFKDGGWIESSVYMRLCRCELNSIVYQRSGKLFLIKTCVSLLTRFSDVMYNHKNVGDIFLLLWK